MDLHKAGKRTKMTCRPTQQVREVRDPGQDFVFPSAANIHRVEIDRD